MTAFLMSRISASRRSPCLSLRGTRSARGKLVRRTLNHRDCFAALARLSRLVRRHAGEDRYPRFSCKSCGKWIPACAGMTAFLMSRISASRRSPCLSLRGTRSARGKLVGRTLNHRDCFAALARLSRLVRRHTGEGRYPRFSRNSSGKVESGLRRDDGFFDVAKFFISGALAVSLRGTRSARGKLVRRTLNHRDCFAALARLSRLVRRHTGEGRYPRFSRKSSGKVDPGLRHAQAGIQERPLHRSPLAPRFRGGDGTWFGPAPSASGGGCRSGLGRRSATASTCRRKPARRCRSARRRSTKAWVSANPGERSSSQ